MCLERPTTAERRPMPSSPTEILLPHRPTDTPLPVAVTDSEQLSLFVALRAVPDPRDPRGRRYPLVSMLAVAMCAVLAGACTFAAIADWVRDLDRGSWARLGFTDRVPAATTVWRLLIRVDAQARLQVRRHLRHRQAAPLPLLHLLHPRPLRTHRMRRRPPRQRCRRRAGRLLPRTRPDHRSGRGRAGTTRRRHRPAPSRTGHHRRPDHHRRGGHRPLPHRLRERHPRRAHLWPPHQGPDRQARPTEDQA